MDDEAYASDQGSSPHRSHSPNSLPPEYNKQELNPDVNELFAEEQGPDQDRKPAGDHVRFKDETLEQGHLRTEAIAKARPNPTRNSGQEGNKPDLRSDSGESITSHASSVNGGDAEPLYSDQDSKDLDHIDAGRLFGGTEPQVTNDLAARRGQNRPTGLELKDSIDNGKVAEPPSSATFTELLKATVTEPEVQAKLLASFNNLNELKNKTALNTFRLYERQKKDNEELMSDYYSGAGEELRRARKEAELREKDTRRRKKERAVQMAISQEARAARLAAMGEDEESKWGFDEKGMLISPENDEDDVGYVSEDSDNDCGEEDEWQGGVKYSDDEEDVRETRTERIEPSINNDDDEYDNEWPGDRASRLPIAASAQHARHPTRPSTLSLDKPLPSIPHGETQQTLTSIHVLLRLLPVKVALIDQTNRIRHPDPATVHAICEKASEVCEYSGRKQAALALQGRCAFYMGLAEYLRSKVDSESAEIYPAVTLHFENAAKLCSGIYEEGVWAEEWARWLRHQNEYFEGAPGKAAPKMRPAKGQGGVIAGLVKGVTSYASALWSGSPPQGEGERLSDLPSWSEEGSGSECSSAEQKPAGLGIDTGVPRASQNTVLSPSAGIFASPERYANGIDRSPTSPTYDNVNDGAGCGSSETIETSPEIRRGVGGGMYRITNPDPPSQPNSKDSPLPSEEKGLPPPVTTSATPAVSLGGTNFMANLSRRLSQFTSPPASNATSPTPTSPTRPPIDEEVGNHDPEAGTHDPEADTRRLSIAERRRKGSLAEFGSRLLNRGKAPSRAGDLIYEAEEGNSPLYQTSFEGEGVVVGRGDCGKSPSRSPGLRRRRSGAGADADMV